MPNSDTANSVSDLGPKEIKDNTQIYALSPSLR